MKNAFALLLMLVALNCFSQELPSPYEKGFAFPIGTKFTIKLDTKDTSAMTYSIIKFEEFTQTIDTWDNDKLFDKNGEEDTIEFYFCLGTHGENEKEKEKNMQVLLLFKNRTKFALSYLSEIQTDEDGEFKETSNMGTFPGAKGTEMWPYMIHAIGLKDFKIIK